jgi:SAM-dependent methyltransferase
MFAEHILACPKCGGNLEVSASKWTCTNCRKDWVIDEDGVVHLKELDYFFGANRKRFGNLLAEIRKMTLEELRLNVGRLEEEYEDFSYSYCLDSTRADWTVLGNFHRKIIVDLGCGFGSISLPLARIAKVVLSVDATLDRLSFLSIVSKLEGLKNVVPVHSDVLDLPLKEESVDAFIIVGLLEWMGTSKKQGSPTDQQRSFLKYICRLLSKDGEIWIGIENRLNPMYFLGATSHGDLPFAPLMPRPVADFVYRILRGTTYRTRTYTKSEYQKLLSSSGFKNIEFFHAYPHYQMPRFMSSHSEKKIISKYLEKNDYLSRNLRILSFLDGLHFSEVLAPSFLIKAERSS